VIQKNNWSTGDFKNTDLSTFRLYELNKEIFETALDNEI